MNLKLYSIPGTSATVITCALEECGAEYEVVQVERKNRDNPPAFKVANPLGRVPALEHGEVKIYETGAILLYLADLFADKKLAPEVGSGERADFYRWVVYLSNTFHMAYTGFYVPQYLTTSDEGHENIREAATNKLVSIFDFVESQLEGREYLAGNSFSLADLYLHMLISPNWTINLKEEVDKRPNLAAFHTRIDARPAVKKALQDHMSDKAAEQAGTLRIG